MTQCRHCKKFFASYRCSKITHGECDCPKCQGYCKCPEYSIAGGRVFKGDIIIAYVLSMGPKKPKKVVTPDRKEIGRASSPAEAMLMAIRNHEGGGR